MGHVDHGKTKLLDAIRKTNVVDDEAGGITQHIGAYQVERNNKWITFVDTPGHEAFTAMRSRGAKVADIAILVVAADDGVKPQTTEAFRIIETAKIPYLVAINKIDKAGANIDKTKQELSNQLNITPEDWGGKTICSPISAKEGQGIEELLDSILLLAEIEEEKIQANPESQACGTIIESHIDKGAGSIATILIQNGTLHIGDQLCLDNKLIGKVRALQDYRGETVNSAPPSMPVKLVGLKILPQVGDILCVGEGEKVKTKKIKSGAQAIETQELKSDEEESIKKIKLIIKSDMLGSAEAIEESLEKINTDKIKVKIIHKGLGNITDGDIKKAEATESHIIGFHVKVPTGLEEIIREKNISVKLYDIIYDLIEDIKNEMRALQEPDIKRVDIGKAQVLAIFRTEKNNQIIGTKVTEGKIERDCKIEIMRDKEIIAHGQAVRVQSGKQDVSEVEANQECGIQYEGKPVIEVGDMLQAYKEEKLVTKI
jgi:translation initiation factor IF-2